MTEGEKLGKGYTTEELLREYFLRAGFFVVRGAKLRYHQTELTDVDLWLYERSATLARRRTIIDIKDKQRPQASERLFFAKGVAEVIGVEGAGVATSDRNPQLRELARKSKVLWIDGEDLQRLKSSEKLMQGARLTEEGFLKLVDLVDKARGGKSLRNLLEQSKSAVVDRFGAASANLAIDCFQTCADACAKAHPKGDAAKVLTRISFFAAALTAAALDFASADAALRPIAERRKHMANCIRFGESMEGTMDRLAWAEHALRDYLQNGAALAQTVRAGFERDLKQVPADDLAEVIVKMSNSDTLFTVSRTLEYAAYRSDPVSFDSLPGDAKGFVGALLDFAGVERKHFAAAMPLGEWAANPMDSDGSDEEVELLDSNRQSRLDI